VNNLPKVVVPAVSERESNPQLLVRRSTRSAIPNEYTADGWQEVTMKIMN